MKPLPSLMIAMTILTKASLLDPVPLLTPITNRWPLAKMPILRASMQLPPVDDKDADSLSYAAFVVSLVIAAQELSEQNKAINSRLEEQQQLINQLKSEISAMKKVLK